MGFKIFLRHDQLIDSLSQVYYNDGVIIVAPEWVREGLKELSKYLPSGTEFSVYNNRNCKIKSLIVGDELTLKDLVAIARNEPYNVTGSINFDNYNNNGSPICYQIIYAIKDLVRQCVIVARDETTHFGGYPRGQPIEQMDQVYIIDLPGLQFQMEYNSGRLVLIGKNDVVVPKGLLDNLIFAQVVGEPKKTFKEASEDKSGRYVRCGGGGVYFDTIAYRKFVAYDVLVSGLALNLVANQGVNFKFLKYGTGFFAGNYGNILERHIYGGVADGFSKLFSSSGSKQKSSLCIKQVELPFYNYNQSIERVCQANGIECIFSQDDALKRTSAQFLTATTNCSDPHTIAGNEMGYSSVDAAIAENLKSKANIFSPIMNPLIREQFLRVDG